MTPLTSELRQALTAAWSDPRIYLYELSTKGVKSKAFRFIEKLNPGITIDQATEAYAAWQVERENARPQRGARSRVGR